MSFLAKKHLAFKFTLMFAGITLITLVLTSILSFYNQNKIYKEQREENVQFVASYLEELLVADDIYFIWYQNYFLEKSGEILVPFDFDDTSMQDARLEYETDLSNDFPGLVLGTDVTFDDLSSKTKNSYEVYSHEYYLAAFEKARNLFNLEYAYYIVPKDDDSDEVIFVLDSYREEKNVDGKKFINLGIRSNYPKESHQHLWEAWQTGIRPTGHDSYKNEWGKTYAYYTPLFIQGQKMGIIGLEVNTAEVTKEIFKATFRQILAIAAVLIVFMGLLLFIIRRYYVKKLVILQNTIEEYSQTKAVEIADKLKKEVTNEDEISTIMDKFALMIQTLDKYMKNLTEAKEHLHYTQQKAMEMSVLAIKDTLTGVRNKTGYDKELVRIEQEMDEGLTEIGVAMIDLNFLKKINDTYGHDKGNIAIASLCKIICRTFEHSPVFRIGGDEFVVILKGHDLEHIEDLIEVFRIQLQELQDAPDLEYWERTSAAIGYAVFDPEIDSVYSDIFKRADDEMYKAKKEMKAARKE